MSFIVAGCVLVLALLVAIALDEAGTSRCEKARSERRLLDNTDLT